MDRADALPSGRRRGRLRIGDTVWQPGGGVQFEPSGPIGEIVRDGLEALANRRPVATCDECGHLFVSRSGARPIAPRDVGTLPPPEPPAPASGGILMAWIERRKRADGSTAWLVRAEKKADGERSKGASRTFRTRAEAKQYAGQLDGLGAGAGFSRGSAGEYIAWWLGWLETSEAVRPNTLSGYRSKLAGVTFAHKPLARVTAQDVREWLKHLKEVGGVAGRPLSKSSIGQARAILHKAMKQAVIDGLIASNPVSGAALPKMAKRRRPSVLTETQAKDYLKALDETGDGDFFRWPS